MFLRDRYSGVLIRLLDSEGLFNPLCDSVLGRAQAGEEEQDSVCYPKRELVFPSGEPLPLCWTDPSYRAEHPIHACGPMAPRHESH